MYDFIGTADCPCDIDAACHLVWQQWSRYPNPGVDRAAFVNVFSPDAGVNRDKSLSVQM
jgi:hypothetical protein